MTDVKVGDTIRIDHIDGEPKYTGKVGVVTYIDDLPQYHGTWGGLAVNPAIDQFTIVKGGE